MTVKLANIKGIDILGTPRGGDKGMVLAVAFDLAALAQTGGTDTITLGGGGTLNGVTNTLTLAQIIAAQLRSAQGAFTIDWVGGVYMPGYQAGNPLYPGGSVATSGGNVTGITVVTAPGGSTGQNTTSATWDAAMNVVIGGHFASDAD
jgi:hypothetical protein